MTEPQKRSRGNIDPAEARGQFDELAGKVRKKAAAEIRKHEKLVANLNSDLKKHGDPERWKRFGDLLLANVGTAERRGDTILVTDYFDDAAPIIEIDGEANLSISDVAELFSKLR